MQCDVEAQYCHCFNTLPLHLPWTPFLLLFTIAKTAAVVFTWKQLQVSENQSRHESKHDMRLFVELIQTACVQMAAVL